MRPPHHGDAGDGEKRFELGTVVLLRGAEQPVRGADRLAQGQGGGDPLAGNGTDGVQEKPLLRFQTQSAPRPIPVPGRTVTVEAVVDGGGGDTSLGQLAPAELVDGHMGPLRVVGGWRPARERLPLPRQVVVVHDRTPTSQHLAHHGRCGGVQGQRAQVLHHHQVGVQSSYQLGGAGGSFDCMRRPGSTTWARPSPATVRTVKPSCSRAQPHFPASMDTPSGPPRR